MDKARKAAEYFAKLPGIGPRQAKRFVYYLLNQDTSFLNNLSETIKNLKDDMAICSSCYRFFGGKGDLCDICGSKNTDHTTMMIVAKDIDFENVVRSGAYKGRYFILGDLLPILEKNPAEKIRIKELIKEVGEQIKNSGLKEIIIALSANPEGDNTYQYIKKTLEPLSAKHGLKISTLGRGLSTGTELEYSDQDTLKSALKNRD